MILLTVTISALWLIPIGLLMLSFILSRVGDGPGPAMVLSVLFLIAALFVGYHIAFIRPFP